MTADFWRRPDRFDSPPLAEFIIRVPCDTPLIAAGYFIAKRKFAGAWHDDPVLAKGLVL